MTGRLAGRTALISGTGGGQGRAAAIPFAREGANIVGGDLKVDGANETVRMVRDVGGQMISMAPLDLGDPTAAQAWVASAVEAFGGIDVVYNNASSPRFATLTSMSIEEWGHTLRNELDLVFTVTRAAWPHLVSRGGGAVVTTASIQGINALRLTVGGFAHATTKHGLIGMTRELANEGGPVGIRVNAVSPGFILTPATEELAARPGVVDGYLDRQVIRRLGRPEDVAAAALFLASDEASFITGHNLVVDGGYTIV